MEAYILVSFWLGIFAFVVRVAWIYGGVLYPRKTTIREDISSTLISIPFMLWAAYLLWGN